MLLLLSFDLITTHSHPFATPLKITRTPSHCQELSWTSGPTLGKM